MIEWSRHNKLSILTCERIGHQGNRKQVRRACKKRRKPSRGVHLEHHQSRKRIESPLKFLCKLKDSTTFIEQINLSKMINKGLVENQLFERTGDSEPIHVLEQVDKTQDNNRSKLTSCQRFDIFNNYCRH